MNPSALQADIAAFLSSLVSPVVNDEAVDIQNVSLVKVNADDDAGDALTYDRVMNALKGEVPRNGKFGLAIVIGRPEMVNASPNSRVLCEDLEVIIEVVEDTALNRAPSTGTGVKLDVCRMAVAVLLHGWSHDGKHGLIYLRSDPIPDAALDAGKRGWQLTFQSKAHAHAVPDQVARPVPTDGGPTLTITCATSGAAIYYTLDGSPPSKEATLYSTAVDINGLPTGTIARAAAYKNGLRPSDTAEIVL
jgi:hypothetical protein